MGTADSDDDKAANFRPQTKDDDYEGQGEGKGEEAAAADGETGVDKSAAGRESLFWVEREVETSSTERAAVREWFSQCCIRHASEKHTHAGTLVVAHEFACNQTGIALASKDGSWFHAIDCRAWACRNVVGRCSDAHSSIGVRLFLSPIHCRRCALRIRAVLRQ